MFETTIRILGGLLSAYALTKEQVYLDGAKLTGDRLLPAFNSASGVPFADVNMKSGQSENPTACLAEATTVQLEFKYLSYLTKVARATNSHIISTAKYCSALNTAVPIILQCP